MCKRRMCDELRICVRENGKRIHNPRPLSRHKMAFGESQSGFWGFGPRRNATKRFRYYLASSPGLGLRKWCEIIHSLLMVHMKEGSCHVRAGKA